MKAHDNQFPKILVTETAAPASPAAGDQALFIDPADHILKLKNAAGTITSIAPDAAVLTYVDFVTAAAPSNPSAGRIRVYSKTADHLAQRTSAGVETLLDSAGGGAGAGAGTFVQAKGPTDLAGGGTITLDSAPINGNLLIAFYYGNQYPLNIGSGITQTNVTWTRIGQAYQNTGGYAMFEVWKGVVAASPGSVITISPTSNNTQGIYVQEWSGATVLDGVSSKTFPHPQYIGGNIEPIQFQDIAWPASGAGGRVIVGFYGRGSPTLTAPDATAASGSPFSLSIGRMWIGSVDLSATSANAFGLFLNGMADNTAGILIHIRA